MRMRAFALFLDEAEHRGAALGALSLHRLPVALQLHLGALSLHFGPALDAVSLERWHAHP